jgi:3-mercaptopyruvate sulfurtransferase SseA
MGKLIDLKTWKDRRFENQSLRTVQHWARNGHIPGAKKIGHKWFVDEAVERSSSGNELADSILMSS